MILETVGLSRAFGAVIAVDAVDMAVEAGSVHAVIGPNGAGKTTLLNLLSGELAPSEGRIRFAGRDVAGLPPDRIARRGIGRTFQRVTIFPAATCLETCWLGARAAADTRLRFFRSAAADRGSHARAADSLAAVGLAHRAATPAGTLSHGEQRQLELAAAERLVVAVVQRLHLAHVFVHPHPLGERSVDVHRLARDALALFRLLDEVERAHVVQAVRKLNQYNTNIFCHGEQKLHKRFSLLAVPVLKYAGNFRHAINQVSYHIPKVIPDII